MFVAVVAILFYLRILYFSLLVQLFLLTRSRLQMIMDATEEWMAQLIAEIDQKISSCIDWVRSEHNALVSTSARRTSTRPSSTRRTLKETPDEFLRAVENKLADLRASCFQCIKQRGGFSATSQPPASVLPSASKIAASRRGETGLSSNDPELRGEIAEQQEEAPSEPLLSPERLNDDRAAGDRSADPEPALVADKAIPVQGKDTRAGCS